MPEFLRLSNRLQGNEFGFPRGTSGEVDETKATVQPPRKNPSVEPQTFLNDFTSRFQGASEGYGALTPFAQYLSGQGALTVSEDDGQKDSKPKSQFSIAPGGAFNLQNLQSGFSVSGDPRNKSVGVSVPVNIGGNKGTIGVEGSLNSFDSSIQTRFAFGGKRQPVIDNSEQQVNAALGINQTYDPDKKVYSGQYTRPEPSARELEEQQTREYRSSGGRDTNSPSTWDSNNSTNQFGFYTRFNNLN